MTTTQTPEIPVIEMYAGDSFPNAVMTCVRACGDIMNLTGATVYFYIRLPDSSKRTNDPVAAQGNNPAITNVCTINNAAQGVVTYSWNLNDLPVAGIYKAVLQVVYANGQKESRPVLISAKQRT